MKTKQLVILLSILVVLVLLALWQKSEIIFKSEKHTAQSPLLFTDFDPQQASLIQLTNPDKETILVRQGAGWLVATASNIPATAEYVTQLFDQMGQITRGDLVSQQPEKFSIFQVDESGLVVKITDEAQKLIAHFYVGKQGPDYNSRYVRKEGSNDVFLINRSLRITFDRDDWRERQAFGFNAQEVVGLDLACDEQQFALNKEGNAWRLTQPNEAAAQAKMVNTILDKLNRLRIMDYMQEQDDSKYGLDTPMCRIKVGLADGSSLALLVGNKDTDGSAYYARREGDAYIFTLPVHQVDKMKKKLAKLKQEPEPGEKQ